MGGPSLRAFRFGTVSLVTAAGGLARSVAVEAARESSGAREATGAARKRPSDGPSGQEWAEGEVRIIARYHEKTKDRVFAAGGVEVHYRTITLMADRIEFDPDTKDISAEGNVVIQRGDEVMQAERIFFNLDTERGRVEQASGMIPPSLLFQAESAEKTAPDTFSLRKASVTACTQPTPRWGISFTRALVVTGESIEMWNALLKVKNIPVFYLPYMRYPLEKERATGFLTPRIGLSGPKGFQLSQSYYWAMARNMDATVGVDLYSRLGIGAGLEYRYLFQGGTQGQANLYFFFPKRKAESGGASKSSIIRLNHTQSLPYGFKLTANIDYQTSFDFLKEFDDNFRRAVISHRSSQAYLTRSWTRFNLSVRASRFETYYSELDDSVASTFLPQVSFNIFKVKLLPPLYFSLTSSLSSWRYGWTSEYAAGTERKSESLVISPTVSLPMSSIPWLTANASITANLTGFGQSLDPASGSVVDDELFSWNYVVKLDLVGPVFTRTFFGKNGEPRLKHIIEPSVSYTYESLASRLERIVTPFGYFRYHQVICGVVNRFLVKRENQADEVLTFGLNQTFYLSPEDGPLSRYPVDGKSPRFSEISGNLRFYPQRLFSLDAAVGYNPYYRNFSTLRLSANAGDRSEGRFFSLSWFKSQNPWMIGIDPALRELYNRHQVSLYGGIRVPSLSLDLIGDVDFNIRDRRLLYTGIQATYHYQCLDFVFGVKVFYFRQRPETQFTFSLGLGSIGRTEGFLTGFGF